MVIGWTSASASSSGFFFTTYALLPSCRTRDTPGEQVADRLVLVVTTGDLGRIRLSLHGVDVGGPSLRHRDRPVREIAQSPQCLGDRLANQQRSLDLEVRLAPLNALDGAARRRGDPSRRDVALVASRASSDVVELKEPEFDGEVKNSDKSPWHWYYPIGRQPFKSRIITMATARMLEEFFDAFVHHLSPEQPIGPKGGRHQIHHRTALGLIWFVLIAGTRR